MTDSRADEQSAHKEIFGYPIDDPRLRALQRPQISSEQPVVSE
jgi:hypothetical protein